MQHTKQGADALIRTITTADDSDVATAKVGTNCFKTLIASPKFSNPGILVTESEILQFMRLIYQYYVRGVTIIQEKCKDSRGKHRVNIIDNSPFGKELPLMSF